MRYLLATLSILLITSLLTGYVHAQANPTGTIGPEIAVPKAGTNVIAAQSYSGVASVINYIDIDGPVAHNSVPIKNLNVPTILRVDISANTSNEDIVAYANSLNNVVDTEFPNGLKVIILGVEVNNLDWWYGSPGQSYDDDSIRQGAREYAEKFILFAQTIRQDLPLAPAPPDLFNRDFNADPWMDEFTKSGACPYVDYNVSDIFELTPTVGGGIHTWRDIHLYQQEKMCYKEVIHFEGWGINPNNPPPTVKQQVDWLQDTPLPSGIETATTLILPHCPPEYEASLDQTVNGFIDWWYYINGRVFTSDGLEIDPESCTEREKPDCYYDGNLTRPGGTCKSRVPYVHSALEQYAPQCTLTPQGSLSRTSCGIPPTITNLPNDPQEYMDVRLLINYSQLQLGGLGPDHAAWRSIPIDNLARGYPYNALADKPLSVTEDTPKEAFRTWWRLLSLRQQIEAKAEFFQRFRLQDPPIFDSEFAYSQGGSTQTYTISELENVLPDCLKYFPVPNKCRETITFGNSKLSAYKHTPEDVYHNLPETTRAMYDAFLPFDFDNVRGYIALQYKDPTDFLSGENRNRAGVIAENLPYIQALVDILSNKISGILTALSPQWLNTLRDNTLPTSRDYTIEYEESGEIDLTPESQQSFTHMAAAARTNSEYGADWASDLATTCYNPENQDPTLSSPLTYPQKLEAQDPYLPLPGSEYTDVLNQSVLIPTETSIYYGTPTTSGSDITCTYETGNTCSYDTNTGSCPPLYITNTTGGIPGQRDPDLPVRSQVGRSIITFANPLMSDISRLISEPYLAHQGTILDPPTLTNLSLYSQMLPDQINSVPANLEQDLPMYAKQTQYQASNNDPDTTLTAQAGGTGDQAGLVARKGGQLEIDLCELRNFWLRPDSLQVGEPENCQQLDQYISTPNQSYDLTSPGSTDSACQVKQYLFENICPGGSCSSYVVDTALSTSCSGKVINPYFAITVALNENGGLTSIHSDGTNVKHFGCDPFDVIGIDYDIPSKTACFANTIRANCNKSDLETLQEYGYSASYLRTLNNILRVLGACSADQVNQQQLCVPIWVSPSQAQSISNNLLPILTSQRSFWFRYYQGYLEAMETDNQCSLYQP